MLSHRQSGGKHLDAMFGKARCLVRQQNFGLALDLMNQAVVMVTNYLPAIIEKMKMQLAVNDWEQVVDSAHRSEFPLRLSFSVSLAFVSIVTPGLVKYPNRERDSVHPVDIV